SDLENSTELVLAGRRLRSAVPRPRTRRMPRRMRGSAGRAAAGALRVGNTVGAAISERRTLESGERRVGVLGGLGLLARCFLWALFPRFLAIPLVILFGWVGLSLLWKAWRLRKTPRAVSPPASLPTIHDTSSQVAPGSAKGNQEPLRSDAGG